MGEVWYAAYGSNLLRERFLCYLEGRAFSEGQRPHPGARDPSPPTADALHVVPGSLVFAGSFRRWGRGGAAVYRPAVPSRMIVRLWAVTGEQFSDVVAQECALQPGDLEVDLAEVAARRAVQVSRRSYGRVLWLGTHRGRPIVTMTSPRFADLAAPPAPYLDVMRRGLAECGLSPEAADRYLAARPGVASR